MRVLMSAYVCTPGGASEPAVGWAFVRAAAASHDLTVLTQAHNVEPIHSALAREGLSAVTIVPVSGPDRLRRFEGRLGLGHLDYVIWQWRAWKVARSLEDGADVAHHVTFGNDWLPCALHFLRSVPVVWGPVGGTAPVPWRLLRFMSPAGLARETARELLTRPIRIGTAALVRRRQCTVVATNRDVAQRFRAQGRDALVEPHVALPPAPEQRPSAPPTGGRVAVFAARMSSWKGPYLALEAMTHLPETWRLDMYGAGEEEAGLRRRIERLGLSDCVRLLGTRPLDELREALSRADVLLFPSMHDSAPFVVGEAVRVGCPVVCLDIGGPPVLIEGTKGIAVPANRDAPKALAAAMTKVRRHPPSDRWDANRLAAQVDCWYAATVAPGAQRPTH